MDFVLNIFTGKMTPSTVTINAMKEFQEGLTKTVNIAATDTTTVLGSSFSTPLKYQPKFFSLTSASGEDLGLKPFAEQNADGIHWDIKIVNGLDAINNAVLTVM